MSAPTATVVSVSSAGLLHPAADGHDDRMMTARYRTNVGDGVRLARDTVDGGSAELLPAETDLDRLLAAGAPALRRALDAATDGPAPATAQVLSNPVRQVGRLAPVESEAAS